MSPIPRSVKPPSYLVAIPRWNFGQWAYGSIHVIARISFDTRPDELDCAQSSCGTPTQSPSNHDWHSLHIYNLIGLPNVCATTHESSKLGFSSLADMLIGMYHPDPEYPPRNLLSRAPTQRSDARKLHRDRWFFRLPAPLQTTDSNSLASHRFCLASCLATFHTLDQRPRKNANHLSAPRFAKIRISNCAGFGDDMICAAVRRRSSF